ncbi:MAG: hypothetical protein EOP45_14760 [Sphingobacteriaceae bacterium]|nr:MAG: hypothetical protein EOP45_14760 [Sphingobacteriaceae bacterium]
MKALILSGGYGTRLRPFTLSVPKPLIEFVDKPIIFHQIEALMAAGETEIILAVSHLHAQFVTTMEKMKEVNNVKITFSVENEPLGTAGALLLARQHFSDNEPFFMFNGDVICSFELTELLQCHRASQLEATIMTTKVSDPEKYGVIELSIQCNSIPNANGGLISRFLEKPTLGMPNPTDSKLINAGIYVFEASVLERIHQVCQHKQSEVCFTSLEKEIFPLLVKDQQIGAFETKTGFWKDLGQPKDYLSGLELYMKDIPFNAVISSSAMIGEGCFIGPNVSIGDHVTIGEGTKISNTAVLPGASIGSHTLVKNSIIGWNSCIGNWVSVSESFLGEDVTVEHELCLTKCTILPHKTIQDSIEGRIIL